MKNSHYTLFTLLLSLVLFNSTLQAQNYCDNGAYSADYFWIESVASDDFYHSAGPLQGILDDSDHLYHGYLEYTGQVINWQAGLNPLELTPGILIPNFPMHWQVWIDFNQDQVFTSDELVASEQNLATVTQTIDLSGLALTHDIVTRMRVSMSLFDPAPVCGGFGMGEVEDYTVNIIAPITPTLRVPEDYSSIQSAIDAAMSGDRILVNDGIYNEYVIIDKPLSLESVNGYEHTTITGSPSQPTVLVQAAEVTIKGFDLSGLFDHFRLVQFDAGAHDGKLIDSFCGQALTNNDSFHTNISINGADRITVDGFVCDKKGSFGIYVINSDENIFINNTLTGYVLDAIYIKQSMFSVIGNNLLNDNQRSGLNISQSDGITVTDNECSRNVSQFQNYTGRGINIQDSNEVILTNNECNENKSDGINVGNSDDIELIANRFLNNSAFGIIAFRADNINIYDNLIQGSLNTGIYIADTQALTIGNNVIENSTYYGISIYKVENSLIENNLLEGDYTSLYLEDSDNNVIKQNLILGINQNQSSCVINLNQNSIGNRLYLNTFTGLDLGDLCENSFSQNFWSSELDINYQLQGAAFSGILGNYYSNGDHTDADLDGISDMPYQLPGLQLSDDFSLSLEADNYNID
jgi:parallel beta-helix repeat protein